MAADPGQSGTGQEQLAARDGSDPAPLELPGDARQIGSEDGVADAKVVPAALDAPADTPGALPEIPPPDPQAPLETAAAPATAKGSGVSLYSSDFGDTIGGLQSSGDDSTSSGTAPAVHHFAGLQLVGDDSGSLLLLQTGADSQAETGSSPSTPAAGAAPAAFVPSADPVGPGADQPLFTNHADSIDLNGIDSGGYLDGTQYDAGSGDDTVILPGDADEALAAGFTAGTLFLAGNGDDQVTGGSLADLVDGGGGDDTLIGNDGDDTLDGGNGGDSLDGGAGADLLDGGGGNDSLSGGSGDDSLSGGNGADTLDGGTGSDSLDGGSGDDSLSGGDDGDTLAGGNGRDTLDGGAGNDLIDGGGGNDVLSGGSGDDSLTGGSGRDVFSYSLNADEGNDLILDFKTGNGGDHLAISDLLDANGDGVIDLGDLDAGGHSVTGTADAIVITFDSGTTVTLDGVDGSGVNSFADLVANAKVTIDIL